MELQQISFVVGFLGGVMGGGAVILIYATVSRYMYKRRHRQMVEERKKEINRLKHLKAMEDAKEKGKRNE